MFLYGKMLKHQILQKLLKCYELKVCTYSLLNEYINTFGFPRSRSLFDLCPRSLRFLLSNICCKAARPIEAKFHVELLWVGKVKVCSNGPGHVTKMATMPINGKNPLKVFSKTRKADYLRTWYTVAGTRALQSLFK